jgi:Glycosyl transferase family 2
MKVNLVCNHLPQTGLNQDVAILRGILSAVFEKEVEIFRVHHSQPQCNDADVNIFLEVINPSLFSYAAKNIWIPNIEWTQRSWQPYLHMVNEIWVKTRETERILKEFTPTNVRYIGWTSIDKTVSPKKNYSKAIVPIGTNIYRSPKPILQAYLRIKQSNSELYNRLPTLHLVYSAKNVTFLIPPELEDKLVVFSEPLPEKDYDALLEECGLCICTSVSEGFCHAVNEAMSSGCNLILSRIAPFQEDLVGDVQVGVEYCNPLRTLHHPQTFGVLVDTDVPSIMEALERYTDTPFKVKKIGSETVRGVYETRHKNWVSNMRTLLPSSIYSETPYCLQDTLPKEDALPDVSIVMLTHNRRNFMPLAKYSYMIQSYPEDKLELVVVDDGDDPIEDELIGVPNVKYVRLEERTSIGEKRNIGVENAMYNIVAFMDDDDVYPNNSILHRAAMMLKAPSKECAFCTTIPCYDITKYSSFMNVPPMTLPMSERVSEATLIFTKKFWKARKFSDIQVAEGNAFIHGREHMCRELSPQEVIVSLTHPLNTSSRKIPEFKEPNGCHYGFNEQLFAVVSEIGVKLTDQKRTPCEKHCDGACECACPPS